MGSFNLYGPGGIKELIDEFHLDCTFVEMNNYTEIFEALEKGEVDAGVTNKDFGNKHEKEFDIERTPIIFQPAHMQFAFSKNSSLTPNLLEKVDYYMKELKKSKDSIYYQSLEKWLAVKVGEKEVIPGWISWLLIGVGGIALLLFGGNFILRSQVRSKTKELRQDITERVKAEKAVRVSEEKLRSITENSSDHIMLVGQDLKIQFINKTGPGLKKEDIIGKSINDFAPKDFRKLAYDKFQSVLKTGKPTSYQAEYLTAKGETNYFDIRLSPITREGKVVLVVSNSNNVTERKQAEERLKKNMDATIETVSKIIEVRDPYTAGHQKNVSQMAVFIAQEMKLPKDKIEGIRIASLVHDIGKISVPAEILNKTTKLNEMEFNLIKVHSQTGYDILKSIDFSYPIARIVLQHHERLNGSGYPNKLKGYKILLEAKIIGAADVVEAMSSHRPYRPAWSMDKALEEISKNKGILYDPEVVDSCIKLFKEKRI